MGCHSPQGILTMTIGDRVAQVCIPGLGGMLDVDIPVSTENSFIHTKPTTMTSGLNGVFGTNFTHYVFPE